MAKVKKISEQQFVLDVIQRELDIVDAGIHFNSFEELSEWTKKPENERWFEKYCFVDEAQYEEWKEYFYKHFYDWQPKRTPKYLVDREFGWFNLSWGLKCDYATE